MIITKEIIEQGQSINGSFSMDQLKLLGVHSLKKGWRRTLIGRDVPDEYVEEFILLKNAHIKHIDPNKMSPKDINVEYKVFKIAESSDGHAYVPCFQEVASKNNLTLAVTYMRKLESHNKYVVIETFS